MIISAYKSLQKDAESMISKGFQKVSKNIESALLKVNQNEQLPSSLPKHQNEQSIISSKRASYSREEIQAQFQRNPDLIWLVKDIGKCVIEKFVGSVHCVELLEDQVCVRMTEIFKSAPLPFPNEHLTSFDHSKGTYIILKDDWLSLEMEEAAIPAEKKEKEDIIVLDSDMEDVYSLDDEDGSDSDSSEKELAQMFERNVELKYCICQTAEPEEIPSSAMVACDSQVKII